MRGSKSSARSRLSERAALAGVILLLAAIGGVAAWWCFDRGYTLYFGDAEAHLNIARRVLDSRTPGPYQIGTVWLPLPHVVLIPFVMRDAWWRSGLAGVFPSVACFVLAGTFLFAAARRIYGSLGAALAVALLFALNPNILYLQATPMTELLFLASIAAMLLATLRFRDTQSLGALLIAAAASNAASLTRYEGWFLIPFVWVYLLFVAKHRGHAMLFGILAALGPLAWLAHNRVYYSNALEFYNGPYSAGAIYQRQLAQGMAPYPGDHQWLTAAHYYFTAARLVAGIPLMLAGAAGAVWMLVRRAWWPLLLLSLPAAFYVWSMHSSSTPIFVPTLPPFSWYNTRYAIAVVPLAAFAAGAVVKLLPSRFHVIAALLLALGTTAGWAVGGLPSICWKESEVNSEARRDWTAQAAEFLAREYRSGSGIVFPFGDLTGVLRQAGIPLREGLHEGNQAAFDGAIARPELLLHEEWGVAFSGDAVDAALRKAGYTLRKQIMVKGAPVVDIYHRE
jgi:Dolichyl-phosphate-mannose-protein mannosyltransferase